MITILVEGHSEVESVPILVRRFVEDFGAYDIPVNRPIRVKRYQVVKQGNLEKAVEAAIRWYPETKALILILDADDDCPKYHAPELLQRLQNSTNCICSVVLARTELEAWFVASIQSLRGRRGVRMDANPPQDPEEIHGAKEWLTRAMEGNTYVATDDQPAFSQLFDRQQAFERCRSFRKFHKDVTGILRDLGTLNQTVT